MPKQTAEAFRHYITFIDVLYAVVVGETIFEYGKELFTPLLTSTIAMVIVYIAIISSWLFWHRAISKYPHKNICRFLIDILVLITYLLIMFDHSNLNTVFIGFIVLYLWFLVWDFFTRMEYGSEAGRLKGSLTNWLSVSSIYVAQQLSIHFIANFSAALHYIFLIALLVLILATQAKDILKISRCS